LWCLIVFIIETSHPFLMFNIFGDSAGDVNDDHTIIRKDQLLADQQLFLPVTGGSMADPKWARTSVVASNAGIHAKNAINVAMNDLTEDDRKEVHQELENVMTELRRRKLACFQKTHNGVIKKADTATASGAKVNSSLNPEDLVHMVDVSLAGKYGDDLTQFTRVMAEELCSTFDVLKQDLSSSLPRQVRAIVQQINGEAQGKRHEGSAVILNHNPTANPGNSGAMINVSRPSSSGNPNLQQPFYQTVAYGPNIPPTGNGVTHGPVPDVMFARATGNMLNQAGTGRVGEGGMTKGVRDQITRALREFGFATKGRARVYKKPYPEYYDTIPYPRGFTGRQ
jgi:hypothetical protein